MTAEEPPTRVRRPLSNPAIPEDEDSPTRVRQRVASTPPPRPVDSFLRALSTSIPPAVHSNPAPAIPRAPRLPSFAFQSPQPSVKPRAPVLIEPMRFRSVPRAVSQFSIKNISWAMMPIACAGVFAAYLARTPMVSYSPLAAEQGAAPVGAAAAPGAIDPTNVGLATLLAGLTPMCSGQPQLSEPPKVTLDPINLPTFLICGRRVGDRQVILRRLLQALCPRGAKLAIRAQQPWVACPPPPRHQRIPMSLTKTVRGRHSRSPSLE